MREPLELVTLQSNEIVPCSEARVCMNSPLFLIQGRCSECRLSPNPFVSGDRHYWKPIDKFLSHPQLIKEKREKKREQTTAKAKANKAKDPSKQARLRAAERAERRTNAEIIKSTRNSGRVNRDGDHLLFDYVVLDTKLQSKAENPIVHLHELDKVRRDAKRNGKTFGVLCIKNKTGRAICVLDEADFAALSAPKV